MRISDWSSDVCSSDLAVLMALAGDMMLLPNAAIAEVVARESVQPDVRLPAWLAGFIEWNSRRLPVLRFEVLNGGVMSADSRRERVVIINSNGRHLPSGQFALLTQAYPHLVTLTRDRKSTRLNSSH